MGLDTNTAGVDSDLTATNPTTPTEKAYVIAIDDARKMFDARQEVCNRHATAAEKLAAEWQAKIPPLVFTDEDSLFHSCCFKAFEVRKQTVSTSTTKATYQDMVKDSVYMGYLLYNYLAREKNLPQKTIPVDITPTA